MQRLQSELTREASLPANGFLSNVTK
jgi:hypothetical protein